jgi:hypothetical protein
MTQDTTPASPDGDEPFDEPECERCHGDGIDPWNDYLLPCPLCQGEQAVPEQQGFEHSSSADCWCHPEAAHVDPDTGATVYVHKGVQ